VDKKTIEIKKNKKKERKEKQARKTLIL